MNATATPVSAVVMSLFDEIEAPVPTEVKSEKRGTLKLAKKVVVNSAYDVPFNVLQSLGDQHAQTDLLSEYIAAQPAGSTFFQQNARAYIQPLPELSDLSDESEEDLETDETLGFADDETLRRENETALEEEIRSLEREVNVDGDVRIERREDSFVNYVHRQVLDYNLAYLKSTDKKVYVWKEKVEVLQWVFAQDVINGLPAKSIPCSFVNCCICSGIDPEDLRASLLQVEVVRQLLIKFRFATENTLPKQRQTMYYKGSNPFDAEFDADEDIDPSANEEMKPKIYQFAGM